MKLIDILVEELPKHGGWPEGATRARQSRFDTEIYITNKGNYVDHPNTKFNPGIRASDCQFHEGGVATREQYEAALAASKRCDHKWIPSEGRTQSGYLCSKCGNYDGPGHDWIDWHGGECPVSDSTMVEVRYRNGEVKAAAPADFYEWGHGRPHFVITGCDIIAYRLHKPQEAEQAKADEEADLNDCIGQDAAQVWSGEGQPPVGCECQYRKHKKSEQSEWFNGVVKYTSEFTVVIQPVCYPGETVGHPANFEFRPIRSAEDEKRDDRASAIDGFISGFRGQETGSNKELAYALTDYLALLDKL